MIGGDTITDIGRVDNVLKATGQRFRLAELQRGKGRFDSCFVQQANPPTGLTILPEEGNKAKLDTFSDFVCSLSQETNVYILSANQVVLEDWTAPKYEPVILGLKQVVGNILATSHYIDYWRVLHETTTDIAEMSQLGFPDVKISEQLELAVDHTIKLAMETMPSCKAGTPKVQIDPEVEDYWWISIPIALNCGVEEAISQYEVLIEKFTHYIPRSEADKIRIDIQMEE